MTIITELWSYMRARKKFWMLPLFAIMFLFGALLILAKSTAIAPFIYTLF